MELPSDTYLTISGVKTRHWVTGEGSPVVLLHGITQSVESWRHNVAALSAEHRVHAVDLVGSGRSDKPPMEYSLPALAGFVRSYLEAVGLSRAALVGHSLGGAVSLELAMESPELVSKLVLVAPAGLSRAVSPFFRLTVIPGVRRIVTRPSRSGAAMGLRSCVHDAALVSDAWVDEQHALAALPGAQDVFLSTLKTWNDFGGLRAEILRSMLERLPRVKAPALVVWGKQDGVQPVSAAEAARAGLRDAQVHLLDACGHMPHYEHPEAFNRLALDFLRSSPVEA